MEKSNNNLYDNPKVSVIIPSYNVEKYISKSIESVLKQTYSNVELLVIDDGSNDGTWNIIQKYTGENKNIYAIKKKNEGVSSARNMGLQKCSGKYALFLDSDDWLEYNTIEKMIEMAYENPCCLVCVDRYFVYSREGELVRERQTSCDESMVISVQEALIETGTGRYNLQSSCYKIFDMEIIRQANLWFNTNIYHGEDGLFVFQYLQHIDSIFYSTKPFWNILERENSATMTPYNSRWLSMIKPIDIMLEINSYGIEVEKALKKYRIKRILILSRVYFKTNDLNQNDTKQIKKYAQMSVKGLGRLDMKVKSKIALICVYFCPTLLLKIGYKFF